MIRVLIVHETRLICDLKAAVLRNEPDIEVVGCVHTAQEALTTVKRHPCDVILVSVSLPNDGAFEGLRALMKNGNPAKILITGLTESKPVILRCIEEGVAGYINTEESLSDLIQKIRCVCQGEFLVSPSIAAALILRVSELKKMVTELNGFKELNPSTLYAELTERECEVLTLIEQGLSNQEIGAALCIELGTVKNHVHNILDKLDVRTRKHAAIIARQAQAGPVVRTTNPAKQAADVAFAGDLGKSYSGFARPAASAKQYITS